MEFIAKIFSKERLQMIGLTKAFRRDNKKWPEGFWDHFDADSDFPILQPLPEKEFSFDEE